MSTTPPDASTQGIGNQRQWKNDALALGVLTFAIFLCCAYRWRFDNWLSDFDMLTQYIPWFTHLGESLRDGRIPAWDPSDASGRPFAGSPASAWLNYPIMLAFVLAHGGNGYKLAILLLSLIGGLATYAFTRKIGLGPAGALVAALSFSVGPFLYSTTNYYAPNALITPLIPVGLLFVELALQARRLPVRLGYAALAGLTVATMYAASPPRIMYGALIIGAWIAWRWLVDPAVAGATWRAMFPRVALVGITLGLSAAGFVAGAFWPQWEFQSVSSIAGADYSNVLGAEYVADRVSWATIFHYFLTAQSPDEERAFLHGAAVVVLALIAATVGRRRFGIPFFLVVTLVFIDLGANQSLSRPLIYLIPGFEHINNHRPTVSQALLAPATSMLAGAGFHVFLESVNKSLRTVVRWAPLAGFLLLAGAGGMLGVWIGWWQIIIGVAVGVLFALASPAARSIHWPAPVSFTRFSTALILLLILVFPTGVDVVGSFRHPSGAPDWENLLTRDSYVEGLVNLNLSDSDPAGAGEVLKAVQASETPFRYASYFGQGVPGVSYVPSAERRMDPYIVATLANARAGALGLEQISGYNPVHFSHYVDYINALNGAAQDYHWLDLMPPAVNNSQLLSMLNVKFVLIPANLSEAPPIAYTWDEVFRNDLVIMYQNPDFFERAWLVHDVRPNNDGEGLAQLADGSVDGRVTAFVDVEGDLPEVSPVPEGAENDFLSFVDRGPGLLKLKTASAADSLLVISQTYDSGWVAYVDGVKTDIIRTNHALQGVPLTAGEHSVDLKYEPESLRMGLRITVGTAIATALVWLWAAYTHFAGGSGEHLRESLSIRKNLRRFRPFLSQLRRFITRSHAGLTRGSIVSHEHRHDLFALSALTSIILVAVSFRWQFDNWLSDYDRVTQFLPWYTYLGDRLRDFEVPAWSPIDSGGAPFAGMPSSGWMFLPIMFAFTFWQPLVAYKVLVLLHAVISGFATYWFSRVLGLRSSASLFAAVAFSVGPMLYGATMYGNPSSLILMFFPLVFLGMEQSFRARRLSGQLGWAAIAGIGIVHVFTGSPPRFIYGVMLFAMWIGYRAFLSRIEPFDTFRDQFRRVAGSSVAIGAFAATFGAAVLLPQLEFTRQVNISGADYSNVIGGDYVSHFWKLSAEFRIFFQDWDLTQRPLFFSATIFVLVGVALLLGRNRFGMPVFALNVFLMVDLAATTSLTRWFFYVIPGFEQITSHRPTAAPLMMQFSVAMLAGIGIHLIQEHKPARWDWVIRIIPALVFLALMTWMRLLDISMGRPQVVVVCLATLLVLLPFVPMISPRFAGMNKVMPQVAITGLLLLSLAYPMGWDFGRTLRDSTADPDWTNPIARDHFVTQTMATIVDRHPESGAGAFLQGQDDQVFRFVPFTGTADPEGYVAAADRRMDPEIVAILANGRPAFLGLEQIPGYNPVHLHSYVDYVETMNGAAQDYHYLDVMTPAVSGSPLLDMLNVKYVLVPANLDPQPPIAARWPIPYQDDAVIVYENPNVYDRAWIVHDVQPAQDGAELDLFNSGQVDGRVTAFVSGNVPAVSEPDPDSAADRVEITAYAPETIELKTSSTGDGLLVLGENYSEGWNAYVDGKKVDILRTNHTLRGIPLAAGNHDVVVRYEPLSLKIGLWITGLTTLAIFGIWSWAWRERTRK